MKRTHESPGREANAATGPIRVGRPSNPVMQKYLDATYNMKCFGPLLQYKIFGRYGRYETFGRYLQYLDATYNIWTLLTRSCCTPTHAVQKPIVDGGLVWTLLAI